MKKNLSLEIIKDERKKSRIDKISKLIKKTISEVFLTLDLNYGNGKSIFIMVSHVELSSDGKSAKVFLETLNTFSFDYEKVVEMKLEKIELQLDFRRCFLLAQSLCQ